MYHLEFVDGGVIEGKLWTRGAVIKKFEKHFSNTIFLPNKHTDD